MKYNILVSLPVDPQERVHTRSISSQLILLWQKLPFSLRLIMGIYVLNLTYLICFSSHHFDDYTRRNLSMPLPQQKFSLHTEMLQNNTKATIHSLSSSELGDKAEKYRVDEYSSSAPVVPVLVVILSDRLEGVIPTVASILKHTKNKPVDLVLIGNNPLVNDGVKQHFMSKNQTNQSSRASIHQFTSLSIKDVQNDLVRQGYKPIWTWPEWGSSRKSNWFKPNYTLHVAEWDRLETHAHELNHLRFYLPLVSHFRKHKFLYFLDDDILVQKDLGYIADVTMNSLEKTKGLVTPCNIWIWNSECHRFSFQNEDTIKSIIQMPSLYGDRQACQSNAETHCYPSTYPDFLESVLPKANSTDSNSNNYNPRDQKAWNFGFSIFALDHWRELDLTARYEAVMKESYRLHVFPETSLSFGLGVAYIAFAGAVECWNDEIMKVRDGFGFIEWNRFAQTFGSDFLQTNVDVIHYTGPTKPWIANTTIEPRYVCVVDPWVCTCESPLPISRCI
jgi:lipopolysaccharide biosynthesis glycosyltransferase